MQVVSFTLNVIFLEKKTPAKAGSYSGAFSATLL